ncbi:MAG: hypothetical protein AAF733_02900 [Verrucomicrobiota bacterium]
MSEGSPKGEILKPLGWLLLAALLLSLLIPSPHVQPKTSREIKAVWNLKSLLLASRAYAADHDGNFPSSLEELYPDYVDEKDCFVSLNEAEEQLPFLYHPGLSNSADSKTPLVVDPHLRNGKRYVAYVGGHVGFEPNP